MVAQLINWFNLRFVFEYVNSVPFIFLFLPYVTSGLKLRSHKSILHSLIWFFSDNVFQAMSSKTFREKITKAIDDLRVENSQIVFGCFSAEDVACKALLQKLGLQPNRPNRKKVSDQYKKMVNIYFIYCTFLILSF